MKVLGIDFKSAVLNLYNHRFSWYQMVLRKITTDNSVRYNPKIQQTKERDSKPKTTKAGSLPRKQNKNPSQNKKKVS